MYRGMGEAVSAPVTSQEWAQRLIRDVLAIPALQPLEAQVVSAARPYAPTVAQGFLGGWWAVNQGKVLTGAAVVAGLWLLLRGKW